MYIAFSDWIFGGDNEKDTLAELLLRMVLKAIFSFNNWGIFVVSTII